MTEKDFWTKYFRAEYLHSTKNAVAAAAEAAEDEELALFLKEDDVLARETRNKVLFIALFHLFTYISFTFFHNLCSWLLKKSSDFLTFYMQIRRVDPTLDMEADLGDDYSHLPVCCITITQPVLLSLLFIMGVLL